MPRRKPSVISLFTGAGGLDLGLEAAGFETRAAVEMDATAVATLRANRSWPVIERDVHAVPTTELLEAANLEVGEADLLVGGPPCQPFSKSGYWARGDSRRLDDPRASTLEAYLRVLRDAQPRAFLLENVAGLRYQGKSEGFDLLVETLRSINRATGARYALDARVLKAAEHGVPQHRERIFIIGARCGTPFVFPEPTHCEHAEGPQGILRLDGGHLEPYRTAWDALGDLEAEEDRTLALRGKWADLLPSIPEGQNYLHHTDRGEGLPLFGWRRRYWSFLLKLSKTKPSWTLTAQPGSAIGPFHWSSRWLSMRELCRLQTFPDDYVLLGARSAVQRQAGNAVPALLTEILGREIRRQLLDGHRFRRAPGLMPPRRGTPPPPEPPARVPRKYLALAGDHSAHPGTGLGYGATRRAERLSTVSR